MPTLSPPQLSCCSASELPSPGLCAFPSSVSSSLCVGPEVLSQDDLEFEAKPSAGPAPGELPSAGISRALFSWILLLISFWNLHICSCSSLMKFTTVWRTQSGRKNWERHLEREGIVQRMCCMSAMKDVNSQMRFRLKLNHWRHDSVKYYTLVIRSTIYLTYPPNLLPCLSNASAVMHQCHHHLYAAGRKFKTSARLSLKALSNISAASNEVRVHDTKL